MEVENKEIANDSGDKNEATGSTAIDEEEKKFLEFENFAKFYEVILHEMFKTKSDSFLHLKILCFLKELHYNN